MDMETAFYILLAAYLMLYVSIVRVEKSEDKRLENKYVNDEITSEQLNTYQREVSTRSAITMISHGVFFIFLMLALIAYILING